MDSKKSIPYLLAIIILLSVCFALSIGYIIGTSVNKPEEQNYPLPNENKVTNDVEQVKSIYNSKIEEKTVTYLELENEKKKVEELMLEIEKTKSEEQTLLKYKTQYKNLETKMRLLVDEIAVLKSSKNEAVANATVSKNTEKRVKKPIKKFQLISPKATTSNVEKPMSSAKPNATIATSEPVIQVKKEEYVAKEIVISNLKAIGYRKKSTTKNEITEVASKTDFVKITFSVGFNSNEKSSEKIYFIQVIDSKNNILGNKIVEYLDDKILAYSTKKTILLDNKSIQVEYDLIAKKFSNGTYFVNIFDRSKLVAQSSFALK